MVDKDKLEQLLKANWAKFLDVTLLIKKVLEDARNGEYRVIRQTDVVIKPTKVTLTKFIHVVQGKFEIWVEFTSGLVVGTHVYILDLMDGSLELKNTFGVKFLGEN